MDKTVAGSKVLSTRMALVKIIVEMRRVMLRIQI
jgi:hypothetical protein